MPADQADQDLKARMWAAAIYDDITYPQAQQIVITHYQRSTDAITVAHINGSNHQPLPPGYYTNDELQSRPIGTDRYELTAPMPHHTECPHCSRRYIHAAACRHSGRVAP